MANTARLTIRDGESIIIEDRYRLTVTSLPGRGRRFQIDVETMEMLPVRREKPVANPPPPSKN